MSLPSPAPETEDREGTEREQRTKEREKGEQPDKRTGEDHRRD